MLGDPIDWLPDNRTLLVKSRASRPRSRAAEPRVPTGPHVQESDGHAGPVATYEDLLQNPHDEDLFEYYATAQLVRIDTGERHRHADRQARTARRSQRRRPTARTS